MSFSTSSVCRALTEFLTSWHRCRLEVWFAAAQLSFSADRIYYHISECSAWGFHSVLYLYDPVHLCRILVSPPHSLPRVHADFAQGPY